MATFGLPTLLIENLDTATASRTTVGNTTIATVPSGQIWKIRKIELFREGSGFGVANEVSLLRISNTTILDINEDIETLIVKTGTTDLFGSGPYLDFGPFIDDPYYYIYSKGAITSAVTGTIVAIEFKENYLLLKAGDLLRFNLASGVAGKVKITYDRYTQV